MSGGPSAGAPVQSSPVDVLVIGAGQAGLSVGYWLTRYGIRPGSGLQMVDADPGPGGAWAHRWDSLRLGKTHRVHDLPGLPMGPVDPQRRASDAVGEYFARYEAAMDLRVLRPVRVRAVRHAGDRLLVEAGERAWQARFVVNATGTWTRPFVPRYPGQDTFAGRQLHTVDFRSADEFAGQRVMVVGGGASAVQLLAEISEVAETLWVTRREPVWHDGPFSEELGRDVIARVDAHTRAGGAPTSVVSNTGLFRSPLTAGAQERGVYRRLPMFQMLTPDGATWADGSHRRLDAILWATGFRPAIEHLAPLRLRTRDGGIRVAEGRSLDEPRLFLAGYGPSASTIGANRAGRVIARQIRDDLARR